MFKLWYCDECFVFWGKEKDKHYNHDIYNLKNCIKEYNKLEKSLKEYSNFIDNLE